MISQNIHILTSEDLKAIKDAAFRSGVKRAEFEKSDYGNLSHSIVGAVVLAMHARGWRAAPGFTSTNMTFTQDNLSFRTVNITGLEELQNSGWQAIVDLINDRCDYAITGSHFKIQERTPDVRS